MIRWQNQYDELDSRMGKKDPQGAYQDRLACQLKVLLGKISSHTGAKTCCRDDGGSGRCIIIKHPVSP
jgi:hypothetical protein